MKRQIACVSVLFAFGMGRVVMAGQAAAGSATAQAHVGHAAAEGPPLTLKAALDEALAKNLDVAALRAQVSVTRQRPAQERSLAPPMLEGTIWQWPFNSINPANTNMYMFMVGQVVPGRGKRELRAAVAETDIALAQTDVTIRTRQVVNEVKQAYAMLFIARKATEVHLASVELLRQIADVSQTKYATGRISQQDVLKPVVELSKLHGDLLMFEEQAGIAAARLNVLLARAPEAPIGPLTEPTEQTLLPAPTELQRLALDRQPELERAHLEIERAEAELASAKQEYKPDFTVQGGYLLMPNQTDAWLARVGVTWPRAPWARDKIGTHIIEQIAASETAKARERTMQNMVRLAVQEAYVRAKSAQERALLLRTTILPQAQQTLDVSRIGYQTDRVDFQAVIENQRTLLDAQLGYVRALSEFEQATADLERAVGADLPEGTTVSVTNQPPRSPSTPRNSSLGAVGVPGGLHDGGVR
jgi:cobalt-zinc-cadmium efflux system outer membrane protein